MLYALYYQLGAKSLTSHLKIKTEKRKARSCRDQKIRWFRAFFG